MIDRLIHIRNWDRYQHRDTTRNKKEPARWIMDHTSQRGDPAWVDLTYAERGLLQSLRLEYAANRGRGLPDSTATLGRLLGWRVYRSQLERLEQAGFIEFLPATSAQPAQQTREDKRREDKKEQDQNPPNDIARPEGPTPEEVQNLIEAMTSSIKEIPW